MPQIDLKNTTITLRDAGVNSLVVKVANGVFNWSETKNRKYVTAREDLDTVVDEVATPVEIRFDLIWEFLRASAGSGTPTPHDVMKNRGEAAAWVSTDADICAPFSIDVELVHNPGCAGVQSETILFSDFRYEKLEQDPKAGTLSVSGKCNQVEPTVTRS